jgi:membrane protein YqaA with SNARE-associated domain
MRAGAVVGALILAVRWGPLLRRWGGAGLLALGIVDSSIIPTFGSLDVFTVILAARHQDLWFYYAAMSTAGSLIGALLTYRLGRRAGTAWLEKRVGQIRFDRVRRLLDRWGFGALLVSVLAPPPFPTPAFLLVAGTAEYPVRRFVAAVLLGRAVRYSLLAFVGIHFGRPIIRVLRHPDHYLAASLLLTAALIAVVAAMMYLLGRRRHDQENSRRADAT